jgi:uncharacterized protein (DUF983 family)
MVLALPGDDGFCSPEHEREYRAFWEGFAEAVDEEEKATERRRDHRADPRPAMMAVKICAFVAIAISMWTAGRVMFGVASSWRRSRAPGLTGLPA